MRSLKRMAALLTAMILCLGLSVTAFAAEADTGFPDVDAGAWYAEAAAYCRDSGLMSGTGATTFSPDTPMTRGMLVTVLYRLADSPSLEQENLGYPIWWGDAPKIVSTFLESCDFEGKTIVPFCNSGSSSIGGSGSDLEALTDGAAWLDGQRFSGSASQETVSQWVDALGLDPGQAA